MERMRTKTTALPTTSRRSGAAARFGVAVLLAAAALLLGVVTARAQAPDLNEAVADGWQGYEQQPLRVNVWHDRDDDDVYSRGESVRVHFETNYDAYVVVYRVDADGRVDVLWPRSRYDDGFVFGHHTYHVPAAGAPRLRAADVDGVEYVQALVSAYPFDLRGLDIDFLHEREDVVRAYYVAGDPFLAMNDVNYEITGLEDAEDYVASAYATWYVGRKVDHPRFLCGQCHEDEPEPYREACVVEIHHDYGWANRWYTDYGYYPVYYYPAYYYVDPWTWRPWVNYWYRPWYRWPSYSSGWGFDCYVWNYSPYWSGDVWVRYKDGDRRHRPLGKGERYKRVADGAEYRHPGALGKSPRPTQNMLAALDDRGPVSKGERRGEGIGKRDAFKDVPRAKQPRATFSRKTDATPRSGLRLDRTRYPSTIGSGATTRGDAGRVRSGTAPGDRGNAKGDRVTRPTPSVRGGDNNLVRPVEPRSKGSRIWQGGRNSGSTRGDERAVKPAPRRDTSRSGSRVDRPRTDDPSSRSRVDKPRQSTPRSRSSVDRPKSSNRKSGGKSPTVRPGSSSRSRQPKAVNPRSSSGSRRSSAARSSGGSSSSRSSGSKSSGGKSKGGSAKKR